MDAGGKVDGSVPKVVLGVSDKVSSRVPPFAMSAWRNQTWVSGLPFS